MVLETMSIALVGLFVLGLLTGTASGVLGIGGGLLMVPALLVWGAPIQQAIATSLVGVLLSSLSGSLRNWRAGELNLRASFGLALGGITTAQLGAWLGNQVPAWVLAFSFAALQLATIYLMSLRRQLATQTHGDASAQSWQGFAKMFAIGLLAGFLSGLFGVGGGVVMVPLQMLVLGVAIKGAVRTSLGAIVPIAISGLLRHTLQGNVLWMAGLCLGCGGIFGAQFGSRTLPKLPERRVNLLFRLLLLLMAGYTIFEGVSVLQDGAVSALF